MVFAQSPQAGWGEKHSGYGRLPPKRVGSWTGSSFLTFERERLPKGQNSRMGGLAIPQPHLNQGVDCSQADSLAEATGWAVVVQCPQVGFP